jgi:hypothetical protein
MKTILSRFRWVFTGVGLFLPFIPRFVGVAFGKMAVSTFEYWKDSQHVVETISDDAMAEATNEEKGLGEYDTYVYWACYLLASFLYLVGWLIQAWITMEAFRLLLSIMP